MRTPKINNDIRLFIVTSALVAVGLMMVFSASSGRAVSGGGDETKFLTKQAIGVGAGLFGMLVLWKTDYRKLQKYAIYVLALAVVALALVLIPGVGTIRNGARRWLVIGTSFQPSEFAKPALILFLAAWLPKSFLEKRFPEWSGDLTEFVKGLLPYLLVIGIIAGLIKKEPDFGTAAELAIVAVGMLYVAGARFIHLGAVGFAAMVTVVFSQLMVDFRWKRIMAYRDPWSDQYGAGYQAIQSFLALGSGGLTGLGPGMSRQKMKFLPEPNNDFIYSVIGEEWGLVGTVIVAAAFVVFVYFGVRIALSARDAFGRNLAFGLTFLTGFQALINMGVATGLFPNKGMQLPFVSAGGTGVMVALLSVGLMMSVARIGTEEAGYSTMLRPAA